MKKESYSKGMSKALLLLKKIKPTKPSADSDFPGDLRLEVEGDLCISGYDNDPDNISFLGNKK